MMLRALVLALLIVAVAAEPSGAKGDKSNAVVHSGGTGLTTVVTQAQDGERGPSVSGSPISDESHAEGQWVTVDVCSVGGQALCQTPSRCSDGSPQQLSVFITTSGVETSHAYTCVVDTGVAPVAVTPVITQPMVLAALKRVGLPGSRLLIEPPRGATLVNLRTNFHTEQPRFTRTVRLLGQRVTLDIWPSRFTWHFGDGARLVSSGPGTAYPRFTITHTYRHRQRLRPWVDTTYSARFRVGDGPWRDVVGTVTIAGPPTGLEVRTATPHLTG